MNDDEVTSRAELPSTVVRSLGVPTVNLDRALQVAGDLEDEEIAHAAGAVSTVADADEQGEHA